MDFSGCWVLGGFVSEFGSVRIAGGFLCMFAECSTVMATCILFLSPHISPPPPTHLVLVRHPTANNLSSHVAPDYTQLRRPLLKTHIRLTPWPRSHARLIL